MTSNDTRELYLHSKKKKCSFLLITGLLLIITCIFSLGIGSVEIDFLNVVRVFVHPVISAVPGPDHDWYSNIILNGRLPRTILCILCGMCLAISGAVMQNLLRNPLVSPFTLGVSSAASFGASISIILCGTVFSGIISNAITVLGVEINAKNIITVIFAFLFGLISIGFILILARRKDLSKSTIILSGVIIGYLFQAGVSFAKYVSNDDALREITLWLMGGMWNASWGTICLLIPVVLIVTAILEADSMKINTLAAGDDVAESLGVDVKNLRTRNFILCTLITSACIAFTGVIGFVGLIAPHVCRMIIGNDSRYLIPASALFGSLLLLISDIVSRVIIRPEELPVGIIMYILGGLFFIWTVTTRSKEVKM